MSSTRSTASFFVRILAVSATLAMTPLFSIQSQAALIDPDIWWHIRVGEWITQHHAWPHVAIFSQHSERAWVAYSWGFELLVSSVTRWFGLPGIPVLLILVQVLLSLVLMLSFRHLSGRFWPSWLISVLTIYAYYTNPLRPQLLTSLFFMFELLLIFEAEQSGEDRPLFWIALLFLLWANCHIQFIYGLFVLGLYAGARLISVIVARWRPSETPSRSPLRAWLAFLLAAVACCLGPYGISPFKVAFTAAGNTTQYQLIQELAAMDFRRPEHFVQLLLVMMAAWALGRSRRVDPFRALLLLATAMVSFRSLRDSWFVCVAAGFILAESARRERESEAPARRTDSLRWGVIYAAGTAISLTVSLGMARHQGLDLRSLAAPLTRMYPIAASDFIRNSRLSGPMFNAFNWGGFLIFDLPEQPVSIDGRVDAYGADIVARDFDTELARRWQLDPDLARANLVLLPRTAPLAVVLANAPPYRLVYQDNVAVVFERRQNFTSTAAAP